MENAPDSEVKKRLDILARDIAVLHRENWMLKNSSASEPPALEGMIWLAMTFGDSKENWPFTAKEVSDYIFARWRVRIEMAALSSRMWRMAKAGQLEKTERGYRLLKKAAAK